MSKNAVLLALAVAAVMGGACVTDPNDEQSVELSSTQCASAAPWAEAHRYSVGDVVQFGGSIFQCRQAHTSQADWTPPAVPALWAIGQCSGGGAPPPGGGGGGGSGGGGATCDPNAWVYMASDANACVGHVGESCGWTTSNLG